MSNNSLMAEVRGALRKCGAKIEPLGIACLSSPVILASRKNPDAFWGYARMRDCPSIHQLPLPKSKLFLLAEFPLTSLDRIEAEQPSVRFYFATVDGYSLANQIVVATVEAPKWATHVAAIWTALPKKS